MGHVSCDMATVHLSIFIGFLERLAGSSTRLIRIVGDAEFGVSFISHQVLCFAKMSGQGAYHYAFLTLPFVLILSDVLLGSCLHFYLTHGGTMAFPFSFPVSLLTNALA